ncbi:hypothetical protein [Chelatococcus sp. XZ-Ab1]|uniref:hypothetical protein n=1 Tax=Chelatococcus sp. XZ-Ab1 TaxID=3034027 RepID=UPI0023E38A6D|nr:hypothetical protein [Chelatococcus sp. XZ-Ab1]
MALIQSDYAKGILNSPMQHTGGVAIVHRFAVRVPATVQAGDIIEAAVIPPDARAVDMVVDADQLDTDGTPTLAIDIGLMSGQWQEQDDTRTCGNEFFAASAIAGTGGVARPTSATAYRTGFAPTARSIGIKIVNPPATPGEGVIGITLTVVG